MTPRMKQVGQREPHLSLGIAPSRNTSRQRQIERRKTRLRYRPCEPSLVTPDHAPATQGCPDYGKQSVKLAPYAACGHRVAHTPRLASETMKARVFITLKNGVLDPQGKAIHHALGRSRLFGRERRPRRQADRARPRRGHQRCGHRRHVPQAAGQYGDREFPRSSGLETRMKSAVIVFPGSNCDRDLAVALEQVTGRKPDMVWHQRAPSFPKAPTSSASPAAFPTAIICAPGRWPRARRSCGRSRTRRHAACR